MKVHASKHLVELEDNEVLAIIDGLETLGVQIHRNGEFQWDFEFVDELIKEFTALTPYGDGDLYVENYPTELDQDIYENLPSDITYEDEL